MCVRVFVSVSVYACVFRKQVCTCLARNMIEALFADLGMSDTQAGWPAGQGLMKSMLRFLGQLALLSLLSFVIACKSLSNARFLLCIFAFACRIRPASIAVLAHKDVYVLVLNVSL